MNWSMVKPEKAAPGVILRAASPVLVDSRRGMPSVRTCAT